MKIRKILAVGALCAGLILSGCKETADDSGAASDSGSVSDRYSVKSSAPKEPANFSGNVSDVSPKAGDLIAEFDIEGFGTIKAVLFPEAAPLGVENFQKLADSGFYDGLTIHRVVSDFMFQGGSSNGNGTGGEAAINGGSFGIETAQNARHFYGALCYANAAGQNTTQFYIVNCKTPQDISTFDFDGYEEAIEQGKNYIQSAIDANAFSYAESYRFEAQTYQNRLDFYKYATDEIAKKYNTVGGMPFLDGNYTVFGQVFDGFDVVDKISSVSVQDNGSGEISKPVETIVINSVKVRAFDPDIDTVSGSQSGEDSQENDSQNSDSQSGGDSQSSS